jgi:hypothetical protein
MNDLVNKAAWSVITAAVFIGVAVLIGSIYVGLDEKFGPTAGLVGTIAIAFAATILNLMRI